MMILSSFALVGCDVLTGIGGKAPVADFIITPSTPQINQQVTFDATMTTGTNISSYSWQISKPDGTTTMLYGPAVQFTPDVTGSYTVMLTVTNDVGSGVKVKSFRIDSVATVSVTGVSLNMTNTTLLLGGTQTLTATVAPANASNPAVTWSSSDSTVAMVSNSGLVTASSTKLGNATITVTTTEGHFTATCLVTVTNQAVAVTGVSLTPTSATVNVGATTTLVPTISPSNATNKNLTWLSLDPSKATVTSGGVVTGVANTDTSAPVTIMVITADGSFTATCLVTVQTYKAVTSISLSPSSLSLTAGGSSQTLTVYFTPTDATNQAVTWISGNTAVATVNNGGVVTPVGAGTTSIIAMSVDGSKSAFASVTVGAAGVPVTGVSLSQTTLNMAIGQTQRLTATITPDNASNKAMTWNSSNTGVVTVSAGTVAAIGSGSSIVTVTTVDGGYSASCNITVVSSSVSVTGISVNPTSLPNSSNPYFYVGDSATITATIYPIDATNQNVIWSSSNSTVASVDGYGNVFANSAGSATITAKSQDGNFTATTSVTVTTATVSVTGVSLNTSYMTLVNGSSQTLYATVTPSNATNKSITWSTSDSVIATVSGGLVTGKYPGTATITVTTVDGGYNATCSVTVTQPVTAVTGISLDQSSLSVTQGSYTTLTATVSPSGATNKTISWGSSNSAVASVTAADSNTANVYAASGGNATIWAITQDGGFIQYCDVQVNVPVSSIQLNYSAIALIAGGQGQQLSAYVYPYNATNQNILWSSFNNSIATVDSSGYVIPVSEGTTTVTATSAENSAITAYATIYVSANTIFVTGISLSTDMMTLAGGTSFSLVATISPVDATNQGVYWWSTDTTVAEVNQYGTVTAYNPGYTTIYVQTNDGGYYAWCNVEVTASTGGEIDTTIH